MKMKQILPLTLIAALLAACSSAAPTNAPAGAVAPTAAPNMISGEASVDSVELQVMESFPLQANLLVKGNLPDGCTEVTFSQQSIEGRAITVRLFTERPADAICTQALEPFEEVVPLDILGLLSGTYNITVNGIPSDRPLDLDVDNLLQEGSVPASPCPQGTADLIAYANSSDGFCLLIPADFTVAPSEETGVTLIQGPTAGDSPDAIAAQARILVGPAEGRSLEALQTEMAAQAGGEAAPAWSALTLGGIEAVYSDELPWEVGSRQAFLISGERMIRIIITPLDPAFPDQQAAVEEFWEALVSSFTLIEAGP